MSNYFLPTNPNLGRRGGWKDAQDKKKRKSYLNRHEETLNAFLQRRIQQILPATDRAKKNNFQLIEKKVPSSLNFNIRQLTFPLEKCFPRNAVRFKAQSTLRGPST